MVPVACTTAVMLPRLMGAVKYFAPPERARMTMPSVTIAAAAMARIMISFF